MPGSSGATASPSSPPSPRARDTGNGPRVAGRRRRARSAPPGRWAAPRPGRCRPGGTRRPRAPAARSRHPPARRAREPCRRCSPWSARSPPVPEGVPVAAEPAVGCSTADEPGLLHAPSAASRATATARRPWASLDGTSPWPSAHGLLAVDRLADDVGVAGVLSGLGHDVQQDAAGASSACPARTTAPPAAAAMRRGRPCGRARRCAVATSS